MLAADRSAPLRLSIRWTRWWPQRRGRCARLSARWSGQWNKGCTPPDLSAMRPLLVWTRPLPPVPLVRCPWFTLASLRSGREWTRLAPVWAPTSWMSGGRRSRGRNTRLPSSTSTPILRPVTRTKSTTPCACTAASRAIRRRCSAIWGRGRSPRCARISTWAGTC